MYWIMIRYDRLRRALPAVLGLVLFAIALQVLRAELRTVSWRDLTLDIRHTPPLRLLLERLGSRDAHVAYWKPSEQNSAAVANCPRRKGS